MTATCLELRRLAVAVGAVASLVVLGACPDDEGEVTPDTVDVPVAETNTDPGVTSDVSDDTAGDVTEPFRMDVTCSKCHELGKLTAGADATTAPGAWMALHGEGLIRYDTSMPTDAKLGFELKWIKRGRHASADEAGCGTCHPVYSDGRGHPVSQYGDGIRAMAHAKGGTGCAGPCHGWLKGEVEAKGFPDAAGLPTTVMVPGDPEALLKAGDNAHSALWRDGYQPEVPPAGIHAVILAPGCAGCHNLGYDSHGKIATCTECHDFDGQTGALHEGHVTAIGAGQGANDPENPDRTTCVYCHNFSDPEDEPDEVYRAACYNCHLSGHQPLDAGGQAHFWPTQ